MFDESLPVCEDYDLWLRITSRMPVLFLKEKLVKKRGGHGDQLSRQWWGMDRFRIRALQKIIGDSRLSARYRQAAIGTLQAKIKVYLLGARKRNKTSEIIEYEKIYDEYVN